MPQWWASQQEFVEKILRNTRYYQILNETMEKEGKRFDLFEDAETVKLLQPYNGQMFVIFGCVILAFPILFLLMFMRCFSGEEDLMEEAMFDLVEISIFSVFAVVEFYMAAGAEIRAVMESLCARYLERGIKIKGFMRERVYNICNNVDIEAYGFIASGAIFLFLVFLFAVDLIILLKNAERIKSQKYLQMAACLHYGKTFERMTKSIREFTLMDTLGDESRNTAPNFGSEK